MTRLIRLLCPLVLIAAFVLIGCTNIGQNPTTQPTSAAVQQYQIELAIYQDGSIVEPIIVALLPAKDAAIVTKLWSAYGAAVAAATKDYESGNISALQDDLTQIAAALANYQSAKTVVATPAIRSQAREIVAGRAAMPPAK